MRQDPESNETPPTTGPDGRVKGDVLADTWTFTPASAKWSLVGSDKAPRGRSSSQLAAVDGADGSKRIYMFGGRIGGGACRFYCA